MSLVELDMAGVRRESPRDCMRVLASMASERAQRAAYTRASYLSTTKEVSVMLNKLVDGDSLEALEGNDEYDEDSAVRRWCTACHSYPHLIRKMIVDVCSRRTGLAPSLLDLYSSTLLD